MSLSVSLFSQEIKVKEESERFSSGSNNAFSTIVYETQLDEVIKQWKDILKDFKHEKVKLSGDEIFGDNILIKDWGNNPVDIYTKFSENKNDKSITMYVAVDLGGAYLTSSSDKDKARFIEKKLKDFAFKLSKESVEKQVKEAEKLLTKLNGNQKDLENEKANLDNAIKSYNEKIKKAEEDIKLNAEKQAKKKEEIELQSKQVEAVKLKLSGIK